MPRKVEHKRVRLLRVLLTEPEWNELRRMCREAGGVDMSSLVRQRVLADQQRLGSEQAQTPADVSMQV